MDPPNMRAVICPDNRSGMAGRMKRYDECFTRNSIRFGGG